MDNERDSKLILLRETIELVKTGRLDADNRFLDIELNELLFICNGCGSSQAKFDFVPDTIYLMPIAPACHIHDFDYHFGASIEDKNKADRRLMNNLLRLIEMKSNVVMKRLRRRRALTYYNAVCDFGGPAFWNGKNGRPV